MRWHFIGIGGIGMSGLAQMAVKQGIEVTGSDRDYTKPENRRILDKLEAQGIRIYPQDGSFMTGPVPDTLIYSTAVEDSNPDFSAGVGISRLHRAEALEKLIELAHFEHVIAVTGSCGKSTVTAYLSETLANLGEDPDCLNGALCKRFRTGNYAGNYRPGNGRYFVFEADESDKSLLRFSPDYALVLNIGTDHYDKAELRRVFREFLARVRQGAVLSGQVRELLEEDLPEISLKVFASGIGGNGDEAVLRCRPWTHLDKVYVDGAPAAIDPELGDRPASDRKGINNMMEIAGIHREDFRIESTGFAAEFAGGGVLPLPSPGEHTALNALAVLTVLEMLGFPREKILQALVRFDGVWRRFDSHGITAQGAAVYDDYAHNPEKISSALRAAQSVASGNVYAVFQPHGFRPLGFMREELYRDLVKLLRRGDQFLMLEPYYAGGTTSFSPTSLEVITQYRSLGPEERFLHMPDRETLRQYLQNSAGPGDVILIMGARDNSLSDYAESLRATVTQNG